MPDYSAEDLRDMLAKGKAIARYTKTEEAWYSSMVTLKPGVIKDWRLGLDSPAGETFGEWTLEWVALECPTPRWRVFHDGIQAFLAVPGLAEVIEAIDVDDVEARLIGLGFVDRTERDLGPWRTAQAGSDLTRIPVEAREDLWRALSADRARRGLA